MASKDDRAGIRSLSFLEKSFGASKTILEFASQILVSVGTNSKNYEIYDFINDHAGI
ncbi:MAG: hypothetical protein KC506_00675 [Nanoarchaeota archaeon]|nr:hypothetical protein [Nanoarchaeota archaeon]